MSAAISQAYGVCTVLPCIRIYIVVLTGKFFGFSFSCCQICTYGCTFWTILQTKLVGWDVVVICLLVLLFVLKWMIQGESFWLDILWRLCLRSFTGPAYQLRTVIDWFFFQRLFRWSSMDNFAVWRFLFDWILYVQVFLRKPYATRQ